MKATDLNPTSRLVDMITGEIIGYKFEGELVSAERDSYTRYAVALSLDKIKELKIDSSDYLKFLDINTVNVVSYNNKYVQEDFIDNKDNLLSELEDVPFEKLNGSKVSIWGYMCSRNYLIPLDDDYALQRALGGD